MAAKNVGVLIKEARTAAGFSQEGLAQKIDGLSASDIGKAERGEKTLTQEQLKSIAKATGVTQKSLLEAPAAKKNSSSKTSKTSSSKTSTAKKTESKASSSKSSSGSAMKVTASEKKILELYREADSDTKKSVLKLLKGEKSAGNEILNSILGEVLEGVLK